MLTYVPFIPASPVQLGLAIWILIPQNRGEKVVYLVLSEYLFKFEESMTSWRNAIFETIFITVLNLALITSNHCLKRISSDKLVSLRKITEKIDQDLYKQIKTRGAVD